jgi:hypothetical protein
MLRRCCCPTAVPILPGDVPMTAEGLRANEFLPYGRLAQSIAFFNAPGMDVAHDPKVVECHVRELRAAGALADRPHAGCRCLEPIVDRDEDTLHVHRRSLD